MWKTIKNYPVDKVQRLDYTAYLGDNQHLSIKIDEQMGDWPLHWHNYFEIEILVNGSGQYTLNESMYDLNRYNAFLLTPIDFHQLQNLSVTKIIKLSFDETMLSTKQLFTLTNYSNVRAFSFSGEEQQRLLTALELLDHEYKNKGNCTRQFFDYVLEFFFKKFDQPTSGERISKQLDQISSAILYLEMHFRENIKLKDLAEQVHLNPNYFSELHKKVTGQTYIERLNQLRVNYASVLLQNGFSVSDACFSSGFGSLSNFLSTFKTIHGISPNAYKKRFAENQTP